MENELKKTNFLLFSLIIIVAMLPGIINREVLSIFVTLIILFFICYRYNK